VRCTGLCDTKLSPPGDDRHSHSTPQAPVFAHSHGNWLPRGHANPVFALSDGTTSLYLSSGGGVIGGHTHESVGQANAAFLETANHHYQHLEPSESFPVPATGRTLFYVF
jgi:hypothetical protein